MATGTRCRPGRRLRLLYALELRGRTARSPSTREVRMPPQLHARPKRSTRPSEGMVCSRAFPSVRASARHDGQRLHECGIQDREALVKAGRCWLRSAINSTFRLSPISCRRMPRRSRRVPRCGRWVGGTAPQVTRVDPAGFLKVSALLRVPRVVASALYENQVLTGFSVRSALRHAVFPITPCHLA